MKRPKVGEIVKLYPPDPWTMDDSTRGTSKLQSYTVAEWRGPMAWMVCGAYFYWNKHIGFAL